MLELVKAQFDLQAARFDHWSVQRNREYLEAYVRFCRLSADDELLDLACGTGEFALFAAPRVKRVVGVDISDGMLAIGRAHAAEGGLHNVELVCHDVMRVPLPDRVFSMVTCRNALHHMENHCQAVAEMARCCRQDGRVATLDIAAYADPKVDRYFEQLEKLIDVSHCATLAQPTMLEDLQSNGLTIDDTFELEIELSFPEYLDHAAVRPENRERIERHVALGLGSPDIAHFWRTRDGVLFFERKVVAILASRGSSAPRGIPSAQ